MAMTMHMTDAEIVESWNHCADKKEQVKILADLNLCSVWNMMEKLKELEVSGLDGRWYQNMNPKRISTTDEAQTVTPETGGKARDVILGLIIDYWESRSDNDQYNLGYAEATISAIDRIINIDPPGLE